MEQAGSNKAIAYSKFDFLDREGFILITALEGPNSYLILLMALWASNLKTKKLFDELSTATNQPLDQELWNGPESGSTSKVNT